MAVPAQLQTAINNAAAKYGLKPEWLVRIWEIESGNTFPNPAVNSIGCGGLFGLCVGSSAIDPQTGAAINLYATNTTQAQADAAAYTLSRLINEFGSIYDAMIAYSGGSTHEAQFVSGATASDNGAAGGSSAGQSSGGSSTIPVSLPVVGGAISGIGDMLGKLGGALNPSSWGSAFLGSLGPALKLYFSQGIFLDPLFVGMGLLFILIGALGLALGHGDSGQTIKYVGKRAAEAAILG